MPNIGIITEQGDLSLGFDLLNEKDQKAYNETVEREREEKQTKDSDKNVK